MRWWLDRQGVVGRVRDESAMEQGTLFHQAMAAHWTFTPNSAEGIILSALTRVMDQEETALREQGVVCVECVLGGTDEEIARHGRYPGTADLVTDNGNGLTVTDFKTKRNMDAKYADGELRETDRSWQLLQYAWFIQEKFQRPVTKKRKLLVAFKPALKVWLIEYPVTQQQLSLWHTRAERVWTLMDKIEVAPIDQVWQNGNSCERYGWDWRCEFHEVCWAGAPIEYAIKED